MDSRLSDDIRLFLAGHRFSRSVCEALLLRVDTEIFNLECRYSVDGQGSRDDFRGLVLARRMLKSMLLGKEECDGV